MPTIPVITPVRLARTVLAGLVVAGMAGSGIALAAGWSGPSSPAPFNNTPELIWNAQETGFTPQDASFNITGSGILGQFAAGGYDVDAGGIAITAPSIWATQLQANEVAVERATPGPAVYAYHSGDSPGIFSASQDGVGAYGVSVNGVGVSGKGLIGARFLNSAETITTDLATASDGINSNARIVAPEYCIDASCITAWPAVGGGGDITGVSVGSNLSGGGDTGDISLDLSSDPAVNTLSANDSITAPSLILNAAGGAYLRWSNMFSRVEFTTTPHFIQGLTTQTGSVSTFSGPVYVTGGGGTLSVQSVLTASSVCSGLGASCGTPPLSDAGTIAGQRLCIGSDCRSSWPAGGGGGAGTVTSVGSGTGLTGGPVTTAGTLALDTSYTDGRYVNANGDVLLTGDYRVTSGSLDVRGSSGGEILRGANAGAGPSVRGDSTGGGTGVLGTSTSGFGVQGTSQTLAGMRATSVSGDGVSGYSQSGTGVFALSDSGSGILGRTMSGSEAGIFQRGAVETKLATATRGVDANQPIQAPQFCIGASCISSWPAAGVGTVTSITQGTGIVATPSPITGAGTVAVDLTYLDSRYVNNIGPDQVTTGEFNVANADGGRSLSVTNTGGGRAIDAQSSSNTTIVAYNNSAVGAAGVFYNGSFIDTYLAWGGTYGVYSTGQIYSTTDIVSGTEVRAPRLNTDRIILSGVTKTAWPAYMQVTRTNIAIAAAWNNAPAGCPAGYKVTGISCFSWDAGNNWPGCTSRSAATPDTLQLFGNAVNISYTLFCVSNL